MAVKNFYLMGGTLQNGFQPMQEDGTAPTDAAFASATGWIVAAIAAGNYSALRPNTERASSTFNTTIQPAGEGLGTATPNAFRTPAPLSGSFAAGNWSLSAVLRSVTAAMAAGQTYVLRWRVYRSSNADGSGATQITSGDQVSTGGGATGNTTANHSARVATWNAPAFTLTNEYLFFVVAFQITATTGSGNTRDANFRQNSASAITTTDFTPTALTFTQETFRGRNDDGNETTATWKDAAGNDWTQPVDQNFRVRFLIRSGGNVPIQTQSFQVRVSRNGGAYQGVGGATTFISPATSPNYSQGANTEQLAGAGTFNPGTIANNAGTGNGFRNAVAFGQDTEMEYCLTLIGSELADGDTLGLRIYDNRSGSYQAIDAYTDTPVITVSKPPATVLAGSVLDVRYQERQRASVPLDARYAERQRSGVSADLRSALRVRSGSRADLRSALRMRSGGRADLRSSLRMRSGARADLRSGLLVRAGARADLRYGEKLRVQTFADIRHRVLALVSAGATADIRYRERQRSGGSADVRGRLLQRATGRTDVRYRELVRVASRVDVRSGLKGVARGGADVRYSERQRASGRADARSAIRSRAGARAELSSRLGQRSGTVADLRSKASQLASKSLDARYSINTTARASADIRARLRQRSGNLTIVGYGILSLVPTAQTLAVIAYRERTTANGKADARYGERQRAGSRLDVRFRDLVPARATIEFRYAERQHARARADVRYAEKVTARGRADVRYRERQRSGAIFEARYRELVRAGASLDARYRELVPVGSTVDLRYRELATAKGRAEFASTMRELAGDVAEFHYRVRSLFVQAPGEPLSVTLIERFSSWSTLEKRGDAVSQFEPHDRVTLIEEEPDVS